MWKVPAGEVHRKFGFIFALIINHKTWMNQADSFIQMLAQVDVYRASIISFLSLNEPYVMFM